MSYIKKKILQHFCDRKIGNKQNVPQIFIQSFFQPHLFCIYHIPYTMLVPQNTQWNVTQLDRTDNRKMMKPDLRQQQGKTE